MTRHAAFQPVRDFEAALGAYTGAPYVVSCDSCTNAIFLALLFCRREIHFLDGAPTACLPERTYIGVAQAAKNAGYELAWRDEAWAGEYEVWLALALGMANPRLFDAAKRFTAGMYRPGTLQCISFQAGKILPIGRGGAILTDSAEAAAWLRRARFDGRGEGEDPTITTPGWHMYLTPPDAARGLWLLSWAAKDNPDLPCDEYDDLSQLEAFR